jgi:predicted acylesterase/phospholipase RssA
MIKHLVISGGGPLGLRFIGALKLLEERSYWKREHIESIYGTSIGSIIGAMVCLKYEWNILNQYIIERPWHDAFKITATQILQSYYNKGLFDHKITEIIFKPLLQAKDLSLDITLQEFYDFSNIDFHVFTFELNQFKTIELSHTTHPNLSLIKALTMSSALPGLFMPTIIDGGCYVDGGVMNNYPLNECLRDHPNKEEVLGLKFGGDDAVVGRNNVEVNIDSSLLEYVMGLTINAMNFIRNTVHIENIENTVKCHMTENPLSLQVIQQSITNQEMRKQWVQMGEDDAYQFLESKMTSLNQIIV